MKCPKCGYNSFEFYDVCKKCSNDLMSYKQAHSISGTALPSEAKLKLAAAFYPPESVAEQTVPKNETAGDMFSFDLPADSPPVVAKKIDDPFNFDEPEAKVDQSANQRSEDVFSDLLESTTQNDESPFAGGEKTAVSAPVSTPASSSQTGEFDLEDFSWDDTPAGSTATSPTAKDEVDGFDSLFGDMNENKPK